MTGWHRFCIAMTAAALAVASPAGAAEVDEPIGRVATVTGLVTALDEAQSRVLTAGAPIHRSDRVITAGGTVSIEFLDGSVVSIGADSIVIVAEHAADEQETGFGRALSLVFGALRAVVAGSGAPPAFEVETRAAVAAARSTEWAMEVDRDHHTAVLGVAGEVAVTAAGMTVVLAPGFGTDVDVGQAPTPAKEWGEGRAARLLARTHVP